MNGQNLSILRGNVVKKPEVTYAESGMAMAWLRIGINTYGGKDELTGQNLTATTFLNIKLFDKLAERCEKYLEKGHLVGVIGKIREESWEDKETKQKRFATVIVANNNGIDFLTSKAQADKMKEKAVPVSAE